ncbi:MAG: sugar phosphate isomerase/epimerase [Pirellulales bacterium]|nr:sugar phosphate isomerase/epimerase [Pirellulales bacterium]
MPLCLSIPDATSPAGAAALRALEQAQTSSPALPWKFVSLRLAAADAPFSKDEASAGSINWRTSRLSCGAVELVCPANRSLLDKALPAAAYIMNSCNTAQIIIEFVSPHEEQLSEKELQRLHQLAHDLSLQVSVDVAAPRDVMRQRMENILSLPDRRLGVAIDTGNYLVANPTSSVEVMLQRNIHQLDAILLRDAPAEVSGNSPETRLPLGGDGLIDYARAAQIIQSVEFSGPCVFDLSSNVDGSSDSACWIEHPHVADAAEHLKICGWFPQ